MTRIGLISDTHGFLDESVHEHFNDCDEIWHAGDFGTIAIAESLQKIKPVKGVYGNIDGQDIRSQYAENLFFKCEDVKVMMRHIGGSPPNYNSETRNLLDEFKPSLFITGHSHILKIIFDEKRQCLHMNPGAAGRQGWHQVRTLIKFSIDRKNILDCAIVEIGRRGH
jgi:putative phosphoesterase